MRIPGVRQIAFCEAGGLPEDIELQALADITPQLTGVTFHALKLIGDATLDVDDGNENNGSNKKASLSFVTESALSGKELAFVVFCQSGERFLIGTRDSVPAVTIKDTWSPPQGASRREVSVSLSSHCAWIRIDSLVPVSDDGDTFGFDTCCRCVPRIEVGNEILLQVLEPNTLYIFTARTNNLTLTLGTPVEGKASEYHLLILTGESAPSVTWPDGISWNGGDGPTISEEKTYEVSIMENIALFIEL